MDWCVLGFVAVTIVNMRTSDGNYPALIRPSAIARILPESEDRSPYVSIDMVGGTHFEISEKSQELFERIKACSKAP